MSIATAGSQTLADRLQAVARKGLDLTPVLTTVSTSEKLSNTKAIAHCYHIALDGSGLPRLQDFTDHIASWLLDYIVPRRKLSDLKSGDPNEIRLKHERLRRYAIETFKKHGLSGEQGEMLLFVLAEAILGLPQLLCKMDLKTDREMHFHGVDGVHCGAGKGADDLAIYWCESKVHKSLEDALSEALEGLKPFLLGAGTGADDKRRELALLDRYMDLDDPVLQSHILKCIDPDSTEFNSVSWRGLCLVGFDHTYPNKPNQVSANDFSASVQSEFYHWCQKAVTRARNRNLESFEIHIFFVPFGFCDNFRDCMKKSLGL